MSDALEILTADESDALAVCEQRIADGIEAFRDVGIALKHVRDNRLHRATHATFEDYCRERWGWSARRGYQLMDAAEAIAGLSPECEPMVHTERAARELARVDPEHREEVVRKAAEAGPVTAKAIKQAAAEVQPEPDEPQAVPHEDGETRAYRVSLKLKTLADAAKEAVGSLNPTRAELIQAALTFKRLGNELERAAAELPED